MQADKKSLISGHKRQELTKIAKEIQTEKCYRLRFNLRSLAGSEPSHAVRALGPDAQSIFTPLSAKGAE